MEIKRDGYTIQLTEPTLHVDNESRRRSGHMTHAMVEFAPGKVMAFNANCSAVIYEGHGTFGWVEYRISNDNGETFGPPRDLPISKQKFYDGWRTISVEKAVTCENGRVVAFCLQNSTRHLCEPWVEPPVIVTTEDGGKTWSDEKKVFTENGRIYDAVYHKGIIYVIQFCNDAQENFLGNKEEHVYRLYKSENNGDSFEEICVIPTDAMGRSYASIIFDQNETLHMYTYNVNAEHDPDHLISKDYGKTWKNEGTCHLAKGSRNIQTNTVNGVMVLHCRGEEINRNKLALYTSLDGYTWDEGAFIDHTDFGTCFYSNNLLLKDADGSDRLLMQYSHSYLEKRVNVRHRWLTIEKN